MSDARLQRLLSIAELGLEVEQARLREIARQIAEARAAADAIRTARSRPETTLTSSAATGRQSVLWETWKKRELRQLAIRAAELSAEREVQLERARTAFGRHAAITELVRRTSAKS